jgi:hypothetical protein
VPPPLLLLVLPPATLVIELSGDSRLVCAAAARADTGAPLRTERVRPGLVVVVVADDCAGDDADAGVDDRGWPRDGDGLVVAVLLLLAPLLSRGAGGSFLAAADIGCSEGARSHCCVAIPQEGQISWRHLAQRVGLARDGCLQISM